MKKFLLILVAFVCCLSLFTQDAMLIYRHNYPKPLFVALKDVTTISHSDTAQVLSLEEWNIQAQSLASDIDSIVFIESDTINTSDYAYFTCPDDHHPHMIDLGLPSGVLWSCCNVGATTPEEYGGYYAWGETEEKDYYDWSTYIHCDGTQESCHDIGEDIAGTKYDVAHVKWGGSWRMPTVEQFWELLDYCTRTWTQQNGVNGILVTGPNGAIVFLPAAGLHWSDDLSNEGSGGYYWSSSFYPGYEYLARCLLFNSPELYCYYGSRCGGNPVRAVCFNTPIPDLTLSTRSVSLSKGDSTTVDILGGSGNFEISNSRTSVVEATLDGTTITLKGLSGGGAVVTVKDISSGQTARIDVFVSSPTGYCPDDNHPHSIDLGLPSGTKWSCCNVNASKPEEYGGYYAWGETEEKDYYDWTTYSFSDGTGTILPHIVDDIAGTKYDIAHVKLGDYCHIPRVEQIKELLDNCTRTWSTQNGVKGTFFTGPNGATIFLPASGMREYDDLLFRNTTGRYWSSEVDSDFNSGFLNFYSGQWNQGRLWRYLGFSVRAVYSDEPLNCLKLSQNSIILATGKKATIEIVSGSGNYEISNSDESVVKSSFVETAISLTPISDGNSKVTVKDILFGQSAIIDVSVLYPSGGCPVAEAVDLGLPSGTRWASWNVGASKPEEFGGYYAWGETEEKDYYDWSNYTHCDGSLTTCHHFNDDIAGSEYDVAHVKWGGSWTLPTQKQIGELVRYCSREWSSQNGVNGILFTGPNGATVFFPAAGFCWLGSLYTGSREYNYYWSSSPDYRNTWGGAYGLFFNSNYCYGSNRYGFDYGFPVRPVCPPAPIPDLSISQDSVELNVGNTTFIEITSGSGNYEITNSNSNVIEATLDGTTITIKGLFGGSAVVTVKDLSSGQTAKIDVSVLSPTGHCPDDNHPHLIDLGLPSGTKWACCNVNASKPEEYGGYYAWGETEEKDYYAWSTYIHCDGTGSSCHHIGDDIAGTEYDVAHVKWGGPWKMPSYDQMDELFNNSTLTWTSQDGINGYLVTGPNGSSIFLPASDYIMKDNKNVGGTGGWYWSSCLYQHEERRASLLSFGSSGWYWDNEGHRYIGNSVRPIVNQNDYCPEPEAIDLGLPSGTKWASWNVGASAPEEYGGYYAWGETEEKEYYDWSTYAHCNGSSSTCHHIGDDIAGTEYDVAHAKWGGSWQMPTRSQIQEMIDNCTRTWTTQNGVKGILVTGSNGASLFFPAAGYYMEDCLYAVGDGIYWTSSLGPNNEFDAYVFNYYSNGWYSNNYYSRDYGFPVRAVCP